MRTVAIALLALTLLIGVTGSSSAQQKMGMSVAADVLLPMGSWGDVVGVGFGGDAQFQYNFTPNASGGVELGYFTWGGKDFGGVSGPGYKGLPFRVFGKYYFTPADKKGIRAFGQVGLGLFFGSTGDREISTGDPGDPTFKIEGASSTDFTYVIGVGAEYPISGDGRTMLTGNVRWDAIATSGTSPNNIGFRIGVLFGLGK